MIEWLISGSIICLIFTAILHSTAGEVYLLRPLFKYKGNRVLENSLARMVLRFAWHITSIMWVILAVILYSVAFNEHHVERTILLSVGISFLAIGIIDLIVSKGRHIGWPSLTAIGAFAMFATIIGTF